MKDEMTGKQGNFVSGLGLILLGLLFLVGQLTSWDWFGMLVLPAMAVIFIGWGIITRSAGLFIPGGIFAGISMGIGLMSLPLASRVEDGEGGLFMLGFAAGWVLIPILAALFTREKHWWALIPAAVMGIIGLGLTTGGFLLELLAYINYVWPVLLIVVGLYLLIQKGKTAV